MPKKPIMLADVDRISKQVLDQMRAEAAPFVCEACAAYLQRRRTFLLPHLGRFIQRTGKPPRELVDRLRVAHHKNVCSWEDQLAEAGIEPAYA